MIRLCYRASLCGWQMMNINHSRVRLRALAIGGYLQRCAIRQFACRTNYVIIIFINSSWVVTRWQWLFYMYAKYEAGY